MKNLPLIDGMTTNSKYRGQNRYSIGRLIASCEQIVVDNLAKK